MPKDDREAITPPTGEQKGLVNEVIVPLGQAVLAGGTGAVVTNRLTKPKDPPKK